MFTTVSGTPDESMLQPYDTNGIVITDLNKAVQIKMVCLG